MSSSIKSEEFSSRPAAEAYVSRVVFKVGPPQLIGAELEWLTYTGHVSGPRPSLDALASALGPHAPRTISPESPALSLPGGSAVTVEPGGQIELSSTPFASVAELRSSLDGDSAVLTTILGKADIVIDAAAADSTREPSLLLTLPRYRAMEKRFASSGAFGALMMTNTAATQVSVDAGADRADIESRWKMLHHIGPAFVAAFACSPDLAGAPSGSWASQRMRTWLELDTSRTAAPETTPEDYATWALDVPLLCIKDHLDSGFSWEAPHGISFADWLAGNADSSIGRRPTVADLDYHLTTLFPYVRASGHLEVRYIDAQPEGQWTVPASAFEALLSDPAAVATASDMSERTWGRWRDAARVGLSDTDIRSAAVDLLTLAAGAADPEFSDQLADAADRCSNGRAPSRQKERTW